MKKKDTITKTLTGDAAAKEWRKQTSPSGMAQAEKAAIAALNKKYPGMYIPKTRAQGGLEKIQAQVKKITAKSKKG